jgi:FPC/CPF motif-containing protein YcgG
VGFDVADHGHVVGALGTYNARHREPGDLAIAVFVALLDTAPKLILNEEITSAHWVALSELEISEAEVREYPKPVPAYVPTLDDEPAVVWGITFGILERLRALE